MKPTVVFTLDFELGWGSISNGKWREREADGVYAHLRKLLPQLIETFNCLDVKSTWGIVGAMNEALGTQELGHLPGRIRDEVGEALRESQQKTFDGRDLIDLLAKNDSHISLCSHTYSHTRLDAFGDNETLFEQEMRLFERAAGFMPETKKIIFPQNIEGFCETLDKMGYLKMRGSEIIPNENNYISKIIRNIFTPPPVSHSSKVGKCLIRETGSLFYNSRNSKWRRNFLNLQIKRGLSKILRNGGVLHIYNHPFNLAEDAKLYQDYWELLHHVASMRDRDLIKIGIF